MRNKLLTSSRRPAAWTKLSPKTWLACLVLLTGVLAIGCSQGSYPLDIFYEMHYQQSYKSQEPPRLAGVDTAVAWFPSPTNTSFGTDGQHLYQVNCSMCHGQTGKGDGPVLQKLAGVYGYEAVLDPDLTSEQVTAIGSGGIEGFMRGGVNIMPDFSKLLTPEEISAISRYITETLQK